MSLPTYTEDGVRYDLPSLYSTVKHMDAKTAIQSWILSVIEIRLQHVTIGIPIPSHLLFASWTLHHIARLIDSASMDQLKQMHVLVSKPFE